MSLKKTALFGSTIGLVVVIAAIIHTNCVRKKIHASPINQSQTENITPINSAPQESPVCEQPTVSNPNPEQIPVPVEPKPVVEPIINDTENKSDEKPASSPIYPPDIAAIQAQPAAGKITQKSSKTIIICPLSGVLFTEDTNVIASKIGLSRVASYTLKSWKNPADKLFSVLQKMALEQNLPNNHVIQYQGYTMPYCFVELQLGTYTHEQVIQILNDYFDKLYAQSFFSGHEEYDLMKTIVRIILTPTEFVDISKPNTTMIEILKKLKQNGCSLYILTNVSAEIKDALSKAHPSIFNLFDGMITSSEMKMLKHDEKMLTHILNNTNTQPEQCILIDNENEIVATAKRMGIPTIQYVNTKDTKSKLKARGILA